MAKGNSVARQMMLGGAALAVFAFATTILVAVTFEQTKDQIAENEKQSLLRTLNAVLNASLYDNELYADKITLESSQFSKKAQTVTVYRARKQQQPVAAILEVVTPEGYGGSIKLLVAINVDHSIAGVRVVAHKETPGLGDAIERSRSDWIDVFSGKSLENPVVKRWRVKKDGGDFDQFTGATITPRAIVKTVKNAQVFYQDKQHLIFSLPAVKSDEN